MPTIVPKRYAPLFRRGLLWFAVLWAAGETLIAGPALARSDTPTIVVTANPEERSRWKRAESDHVVIFSEGRTSELTRVTRDVELLHGLMTRIYGQEAASGHAAKLEIVLVDSPRELDAIAPRNSQAKEGPYREPFTNQRLYSPRDEGAVLIVARSSQIIDLDTAKAAAADCEDMSAAGGDCTGMGRMRSPIARPWQAVLYSAYAQHFLLSYLPDSRPRWYMDGVGALFSTFTVRGNGSIDYAVAPPRYREMLRSYGQVNVAEVLSGRTLDRSSRRGDWTPYHAWVVAHYFLYSDLKPERREQWRQYLMAAQRGTPLPEAAQVFGNLGRLQREITNYAARRSLAHARTEPAQTGGAEPVVSTLSLAGAAALEARLSMQATAGEPGWPTRFRGTIDQLPYDADAEIYLAEAACRSADWLGCMETAEAILARTPNDSRAMTWKGIAMTGAALSGPADAREGALRAARTVIAQAIEGDSSAALQRIAYFDSFANAGEAVPEDAMKEMIEAVRLVPAAPGSRLRLGAELVRQGQSELARKVLHPIRFGPYDMPEQQRAEELFRPLAATGALPRSMSFKP